MECPSLLVFLTSWTLSAAVDNNASPEHPVGNVYNVQNLYQNMCCPNTTNPSTAMCDMMAQIASLQNKLHVVQRLENKLKAMETSQQQVPVLQAKLQTIQAGVSKKTPLVGFHVVLTSSQSSSGKIRFDKIINNYASHWSSSNHTFRAPVRGLYSFTLSLLNGGRSGGAHADIMLGNERLQKAFADRHNNVATGSTIAMMNPGEHAYVLRKAGIIHGGSDHLTHFVGFLIQAY